MIASGEQIKPQLSGQSQTTIENGGYIDADVHVGRRTSSNTIWGLATGRNRCILQDSHRKSCWHTPGLAAPRELF